MSDEQKTSLSLSSLLSRFVRTAKEEASASDVDVAMMRRAMALGESAWKANDEVPVGAVITLDGQVIAEGVNSRESLRDPTGHAEIAAIRQAADHVGDWRLTGCTLYVSLEPCPMCAGAVVNARIDRLVYGAYDPKMGCVDSLYTLCTESRFNHRLDVTGGVLGDECGALLKSFFRERRRSNRDRKRAADADQS